MSRRGSAAVFDGPEPYALERRRMRPDFSRGAAEVAALAALGGPGWESCGAAAVAALAYEEEVASE